MTTFLKLSGLVVPAALIALTASIEVDAQSGSTSETTGATSAMETIVVTARRREERLQDLPGSAAAFDETFLNSIGGVRDLRDLTDRVVGVNIDETAFGGQFAAPTIRGAGQAWNRASAAATGLFRNGAFFASPTLGGRSFERFDTFDVERVEVLRGVQGALYGRNSLGGAINMISRMPDDVLDFEVDLIYGDNDRRGFEGIVNVPVTETAAIRLGYVNDRQDDGFYRTLDGTNHDSWTYEHVRFAAAVDVTEALRVSYMLDYMNRDDAQPAYTWRVGPILGFTGGDPFTTTLNSPHDIETKIWNHNLLIDLELDHGIVSSVTNLRKRDLFGRSDLDYSQPALALATQRLEQDLQVDADIFFQELRYVSASRGPLSFLAGVDYVQIELSDYADGFTHAPQTNLNSLIRDLRLDQRSWAVFGSLDYRLESVPLVLSAEVRYAEDELDGSVLAWLPNQNNRINTSLDNRRTFREVPWGVSMAWHFRDETLPGWLASAMTYAKVGSSYRHGGLNVSEGLPTDRYPTVPLYGEETSLTYELGFKTSWLNDRLVFNGAAFLVEYDDFLNTTDNGCPGECTYFHPATLAPLGFDANGQPITETPAGAPAVPSPTAFFIDNVGKVEAWGVELELTWRQRIAPTDGTLQWILGWAHHDGEIKEVSSSVSSGLADTEGESLNRVRPRQVKSTLIYRQPLRALERLGLRAPGLILSATYVYEDGGYETIGQNPWKMDAVNRLNGRVGIESEHWDLTIEAQNLLDDEYELWGNQFVYRVNDPRLVWAVLKWKM